MNERIRILKNIVKHHQHAKVEGVQTDVQTANAIVTVWDSLKEENKRKFENLSYSEQISISWKILESIQKKQ